MPAPPLVEPPASSSVDGAMDRRPCWSPDVDGSTRPAAPGVDDDRHAVVLVELLDEHAAAPCFTSGSLFGSFIEPDTSIRNTRLRGGASLAGDAPRPAGRCAPAGAPASTGTRRPRS